MPARSVLFVGGTGVISSACAREALDQGWSVTLLNRGASRTHSPADGAEVIVADVRDRHAVASALHGRDFDVVADFLAFTPAHVTQTLDVLSGRFGQYVFISSASAYQTPPEHLPITESTPLRNPFWQYSRDKIACEDLLVQRYRDDGLPMTIVRPSHTYDRTLSPFNGGWTAIGRLREGREVLVPGDGTSLWTLTHHEDFARAFTGLLGRRETLGEAFHITTDEALPWNAVYQEIASALGVEPRLVHVPTDAIVAVDAELGASLIGDKSNSMVFDNSKLRSVVPGWQARIPFSQGAREIVEWHLADESRQRVDTHLDQLFDALIDRHRPRELS